MENIQKQHVCTHCDYKSVWKHNVTRHMVTKHKPTNVNPAPTNVNPAPTNVNPVPTNVNPAPTNVNPTPTNVNPESSTACLQCSKIFKSKWNLKKHSKSCKGQHNALECQYCGIKLSFPAAKSRHLRICKVKQEIDSKALVCTPEPDAGPSTPPTIGQQIVTQNNNNNIENVGQLLQQNIEAQTNVQNQTINIIVYGDEISFKHDHMNIEEFGKKLIPGNKKIDPERLTRVVKDYTRELMANQSNQCVKKTNLKASHSSVHKGDNQWELRQDKEIFPQMMNNIANDFGDFLGTHFRPKLYKTLLDFLDYMAESGYCADDDDKQKIIENHYKSLCTDLKLITYNSSQKK